LSAIPSSIGNLLSLKKMIYFEAFYKVLHHVVVMFYNFAFVPIGLLLYSIRVDKQKLFFTFNLCANMTFDHV